MANSPILAIPLLSTNQSAKETTINDAITYLEKAMNDTKTIDFNAGNVALPLIDLQRYMMFKSSNVGAARDLTLTTGAKRLFFFDNSAGANAVTVKQSAASLVVAAGESGMIYAAGSALRFVAYSAVNGTPTFLSLSDTPSSYSGQGGKGVRVKASADGLEFYTLTGGGIAFTDLSDSPANYTGHGLKLVRVKSSADGVEFVSVDNVLGFAKVTPEGTAARTISSVDLNAIIRTESVFATQITVPSHANDPLPLNFTVHVRQAGDGNVEIVEDTDVVINTPSTLFLAGKHATVTLIKIDEDEWDILGALQPL